MLKILANVFKVVLMAIIAIGLVAIIHVLAPLLAIVAEVLCGALVLSTFFIAAYEIFKEK